MQAVHFGKDVMMIFGTTTDTVWTLLTMLAVHPFVCSHPKVKDKAFFCPLFLPRICAKLVQRNPYLLWTIFQPPFFLGSTEDNYVFVLSIHLFGNLKSDLGKECGIRRLGYQPYFLRYRREQSTPSAFLSSASDCYEKSPSHFIVFLIMLNDLRQYYFICQHTKSHPNLSACVEIGHIDLVSILAMPWTPHCLPPSHPIFWEEYLCLNRCLSFISY